MHDICVSDLTSIGSDKGLSPGRRQAIIRTNAGILLIRPLGTNFSEILIEILIFSFKKMRLKVSSAKRRPFCLGLNELITIPTLSNTWHIGHATNKCRCCYCIQDIIVRYLYPPLQVLLLHSGHPPLLCARSPFQSDVITISWCQTISLPIIAKLHW